MELPKHILFCPGALQNASGTLSGAILGPTMMAGKAKSTLGPQNKPREVPKIAPERVILTSNCNMSNAKKTENTNTEQIMLYVAGVQKRASVHLALFMTTRYNSSNSATGNESTDMHMSSSSARAGFREATGIRRAPPRGETRRSKADLAWSRLGLKLDRRCRRHRRSYSKGSKIPYMGP